MKRLFLAITFVASVVFAADAQIVKSYERPTDKEFKDAVKTILKGTTCFDKDRAPRIEAMNVVQREFNNFGTENWSNFYNCWDWVKVDDLELNGTLYYYRQSFNKIRKEIKSTKVPQGKVALWNVYNMGYIVKTPKHLFGIDIVHKHIEEIAKDLEFVLVTHKHGDHNDGHANNQLALGESKIIAGFNLPKPCVWQGKLLAWEYVDEVDRIKIGDIVINCKRVDHNRNEWGKKFVTTYEIDCGIDTDHTVIFHTGDAHNYEQLEVEKKPDFFIFHLSVGLRIQQAIDKIKPEYAVFSHAYEMGHSVQKWRWTIDDVLTRVNKIENFDKDHLLYPVWGDKMIYTKSTKTLSSK